MRLKVKALRSNQTEAEERLWYHLRAHRFMDLKFKRQKPIGRYIVDFVCLEQRLIVEIDGGQHAEQKSYDDLRTEWLNQQGFKVLRFWNNEVMHQLENVLEKIRCTLSPDPSPTSGRGEPVLVRFEAAIQPARGRGEPVLASFEAAIQPACGENIQSITNE